MSVRSSVEMKKEIEIFRCNHNHVFKNKWVGYANNQFLNILKPHFIEKIRQQPNNTDMICREYLTEGRMHSLGKYKHMHKHPTISFLKYNPIEFLHFTNCIITIKKRYPMEWEARNYFIRGKNLIPDENFDFLYPCYSWAFKDAQYYIYDNEEIFPKKEISQYFIKNANSPASKEQLNIIMKKCPEKYRENLTKYQAFCILKIHEIEEFLIGLVP